MAKQPAQAEAAATAKATDKAAAGPGRPKDPGKRAAVLDAAKQLFVAHGYAEVSMDQIAAAAGVSKLTVYSHFGDKDALFTAAIQAKCEERMPPGLFIGGSGLPLRERLLLIARSFHEMIMSPEAIAIQRVVTTQSAASQLGRMFWEAGPCRMQAAMEAFLREETSAGRLQIDDVHLACTQFYCLLKGEAHFKLLCGYPAPTPAEVDAHLQATVDLFLRAHAPR